MAKRTCAVPDCGRVTAAGGLCGKHYSRWKRHGDPTVTVRCRKPCTAEGCDSPAHAFGFCKIHYGRWRNHGTTDLPAKQGCEVGGCTETASARGMCSSHYQRWYRTGDPLPPQQVSYEARFWAKVDRRGDGECWPWTGKPDLYAGSYGRIHVNGIIRLAHAVSWEIAHGIPVPAGHHVDHVCHNAALAAGLCAHGACAHRLCVNPAHLVAKLPGEHVADTIASSDAHYNTVLTAVIVADIRLLLGSGLKDKAVAGAIGVSQSTVGRVRRGEDTFSMGRSM